MKTERRERAESLEMIYSGRRDSQKSGNSAYNKEKNKSVKGLNRKGSRMEMYVLKCKKICNRQGKHFSLTVEFFFC